jgi:HTH-type transcriptional regulator, glycine betaine synthesis regulator
MLRPEMPDYRKLLEPADPAAQPRSPLVIGDSLVVPHGRPAENVAFERQVVDFFVSSADLLGVPKSVAAIYGIVFASPMPLTFADIAARLKISNGSISRGLRVLREVGALKEVSAAADRAERFMPDLELRKLVSRFIENRVEKQLAAGSSKLAALSQAVPGSAGEVAELKKRLKSLSDWHSKAKTVLPVLRTAMKVTA